MHAIAHHLCKSNGKNVYYIGLYTLAAFPEESKKNPNSNDSLLWGNGQWVIFSWFLMFAPYKLSPN